MRPNQFGDESVDFANPAAVKALNRALLRQDYGLDYWDIPAGYLCPPIPGRADYVHYLADLLAADRGGGAPRHGRAGARHWRWRQLHLPHYRHPGVWLALRGLRN